MKILALDTSGQTASVAIVDDEKLVGEFSQNDKLTHSQTLLPMIATLCQQTNTNKQDIDYIACAVGPGSFTGLRIGAATAKGLCLGLDKKLVAVPTLDALAYTVCVTDKIVCPIMDARRQQVYARFYRFSDTKLQPLTEPMAESIETVLEIANSFASEVIFLGDGVAVHENSILQYAQFSVTPVHCRLQRAASVAALAQQMAQQGNIISGSELELIYLRKSQAEREREERLEKQKGETHV